MEGAQGDVEVVQIQAHELSGGKDDSAWKVPTNAAGQESAHQDRSHDVGAVPLCECEG